MFSMIIKKKIAMSSEKMTMNIVTKTICFSLLAIKKFFSFTFFESKNGFLIIDKEEFLSNNNC